MRMPLEDESNLQWTLGMGETAFSRSTFGSTLDLAKLMSARHAYDEQDHRLDDKYDRRPRVIPDREFQVAQGAVMQDHDARPRPPKRQESGYEPDHKTLMTFAGVSRKLAHVDAVSLQAGRVLRWYYGDEGARWGKTKHGRIFSLYSHTPAGEALVEKIEAIEKSPVFLTVAERLGVIAEIQRLPMQSKMWRKRALDQADKQAWQMYRDACMCWLRVARGPQNLKRCTSS